MSLLCAGHTILFWGPYRPSSVRRFGRLPTVACKVPYVCRAGCPVPPKQKAPCKPGATAAGVFSAAQKKGRRRAKPPRKKQKHAVIAPVGTHSHAFSDSRDGLRPSGRNCGARSAALYRMISTIFIIHAFDKFFNPTGRRNFGGVQQEFCRHSQFCHVLSANGKYLPPPQAKNRTKKKTAAQDGGRR